MKTITIGDHHIDSVKIGPECPLVLMAGPCVIESESLCMDIADYLKTLCKKLDITLVFKASFDKANRSSVDSFRGPGLDQGLKILEKIRREFSVPVVTDIHLPDQAASVGNVVDVVQIPAFLSRQTDLLVAAAKTGKCVQVKKAQFMAPWDMKNVIDKIIASGNDNITLVERGSSFGYNRLICDMAAIGQMQQLGYPAIIDATHATQQPSGLGSSSGGSPDLAKTLARAAVAAGADGLFIETHPNPQKALSDAACMIPLNELEPVLDHCRQIHRLLRQ